MVLTLLHQHYGETGPYTESIKHQPRPRRDDLQEKRVVPVLAPIIFVAAISLSGYVVPRLFLQFGTARHHRSSTVMALINYSDSEGSDQEVQAKPASATAKPKPTTTKPGFQKLVDSSNPHKVRVRLDDPSRQDGKDMDGDTEPSAKRAKIGGGGFSDFNSLLPAPKRTAATNASGRGGLGKGANLKTGATPGFTREPMPQEDTKPSNDEKAARRADLGPEETLGAEHGLKSDTHSATLVTTTDEQSKKRVTMFKPLSVSRKPQKRKPPLPKPSAIVTSVGSGKGEELQPEPTPKMSLFSYTELSGKVKEPQSNSAKSSYKPILYQSDEPDPAPLAPPAPSEVEPPDPAYHDHSLSDTAPNQLESLDAIADSLNLSASARRQLLGRNASKSTTSAIKVTNFNTDAEYAANEQLRQAGETVQHNPIRPIAPGKHSLKQLVNVATMQKDALEDSFAEGRRNKKEAGNRYGW